MNSLIFSLEATIPIFLIIVLGNILMRTGFFNREFISVADKYVYKIALPVMLFKQIATTNMREGFDIKFVLFCMISTTVIFATVWMLAKIFLKDKSMVGAFTQAASRGSAAILGIAFIENIYGDSGLGPLMIVSAVPLFNIYSVIILSFESSEKGSGKGAITKACINVLKNPIIISIALGFIFSLVGLTIPTIALKAISSIAATATPMALLVVGAAFEGKKAIAKIGPTIAATIIKLAVLPLVFLPVAVKMGFRNEALLAIIIMLGSPTTVTCYVMAKNMHNDEVLTSSIVVMATLLSSLTLTGLVYIMKYYNLI